jgi:hypothetical protein
MLLSHLVFLYLVETILTKVLLDLIVKTVYIYIVLVSLYFVLLSLYYPAKFSTLKF